MQSSRSKYVRHTIFNWYILEENYVQKDLEEQEKQVKKMMVKQATMGMRAHKCLNKYNKTLHPFALEHKYVFKSGLF